MAPGNCSWTTTLQLADEVDGLEVLAAAEAVRHPLPFLARVVEIEHRGHRVHAQAVGVVLVEPEQRVREEEVADLVAPVVEDERAPFAVLADARVLVFVERRAVEADQAVAVLREVAGHPVEDDADARLVAGIHEELEVFGRAEAAGRREEPRHLVAPRARERVLHHREQFHVRVAHLLHVGHEVLGEVPVRGRLVAESPPPGSEVHLVDRDGPVEVIAAGSASGEPFGVAPLIARRLPGDRGRARRHFEPPGVRIGLEHDRAAPGPHLVPGTSRRSRGRG